MTAFIFKAFDFVKNNQIAQAIIFGVLILAGLRSYGAWKEHEGKMKQKAKDAELTRKTIDRIEAKSDERIEQADRIRAANPVSESDPRVSDRKAAPYNYRD